MYLEIEMNGLVFGVWGTKEEGWFEVEDVELIAAPYKLEESAEMPTNFLDILWVKNSTGKFIEFYQHLGDLCYEEAEKLNQL